MEDMADSRSRNRAALTLAGSFVDLSAALSGTTDFSALGGIGTQSGNGFTLSALMLIKDRRTFVNRSVRRVRSEVAVSFRFLILIFFLILILIPSLPERLRRRLRLRLRNPRTEPPLSITLVFAAPVESSRTADFGSIGLRFLALFRMAT